jgi:zinc transport system substrate-binding protein
MKKVPFSIGVIAVISLGIFAISNIAQKPKNSSEKLTVVTTLFPLYDFAKNIGQDKVEVSLLLPPGVEAHTFEPKPSDIVKINESGLFVYTGKFMEPWAEDIIKGITNKNVKVVDSSSGVELMKEEAEHEHGHEGDNPFEWAGTFNLKKGDYQLSFAKVDNKYADPAMKLVVLKTEKNGKDGIEATEAQAKKMFGLNAKVLNGQSIINPDNTVYQLNFDNKANVTKFIVKIESDGNYVLFTEHMPSEFEAGEHFFKDLALNNIVPNATEPEAGAHHHHHGGADPHIWLGLNNAQIMVDNITKALAEKDPANTSFYQNNAIEYKNKLSQLDNQYKSDLSKCESKEIVYGGHYAFGYMAKRYGLTYTSAQGFSPDSEPTAKDLVSLVEQIKNHNIKYVFYEELTSPKIAETLANETKTKMLLLNGAHNIAKEDYKKNVSFLSIMEKNLINLKTGLSCSE